MRRVWRKGGNKEKVFGCDLLEHLSNSSQEIPQVLRCCSEFVEHYGVVDGIYRLGEFENDGLPDLNKDVYLQDVHCVSSLCKTYFRELPNPLLTYQLYDKFAEAVAIQLEEERLVKIRDVLKELPTPHYRTLEFLMSHLVKMASFASETNMHARNLAIVWAPNLLRSKDIEVSGFNGTAAFMEVRVQSIVVEFILTHVPQLFPQQGKHTHTHTHRYAYTHTHTHSRLLFSGVSSERRNSLPSPLAMESNQESGPSPLHACYGNISPGDGPLPIRPYHAIIEGTDKRKGSLKGRKWMSIFNIGGRFPDPRRRNKHSTKEKDRPSLRPARSMDSLSSPSFPEGSRRPAQRPPSTSRSPLVTPPTQSSSDVSTSGGGGGSEYAVTYRRGTGLVSGGAGTQGTYTCLDPDALGLTCNDAVQSRSPGVSTKVSRRAAMHITGPTMVTVPLHITSNLALGVLQGGGSSRVIHRSRDKDGEDQVEDKEGGEKVDRKDSGRTERKAEKVRKASVENKNHKGEETEREGVVYREEDTVADVAGEEKGEEKEEKKKEEKERKESTSKANLLTGGRSMSREQRTKSLTSNVDGVNVDVSYQDDNDEYIEMKTVEEPDLQPEVTHQGDEGNDCVFDAFDVLNSTEVEGDDHELSGYVQDNFDFLDQIDCSAMDHIDCSVSHQVNEFSVEPPGHSDDEYEVMEQAQASHHPAELHHQPAPETHTLCQTRSNPHRPLSLDIDNRHTKSLSLPYMTSPIHVPEDDLGSEEDVGGEYSDDNDYSSEDNEDNMFCKSLPCDYFLNINNLETDKVAQDGCTLLPVDQPKRESELLHPTFSACEKPTTGGQEVKDEEEGEEDEGGQEREEVMKKEEEEEEEDTVNQGGDQSERNVQSTTENAHCDEVEPLPSEASTHRCVEFPLPRNEDSDESSAMADMQVEKEKEVVDNLHSDRSPCGADSAECGDFFERVMEQCNSCVTGEMKEGEGDEGDKRKIDKEIEDICQERERKESRSETAVDTEMLLEVKVSDESMREEPTEGGSEEIADKKHEEKMEEHGRERDNALCRTNSNIWDEIENFICEIIEEEESKQGETKGVSEGVDREGCVVQEINQIAIVEEEMINKTEDKIVEEQMETTKEKHKDAEVQQEFEVKEINLAKKSELEKATQEEHVVNEKEQDHDREEVERKEKDKADEQLTAYNLASVDEKHKQLKEVKSDVKESKEGWKFEKSQGGVGRKLVITSSPVKVYQVKAVPVVPPKPQHCKITALTLRQQHQERERRDAAYMLSKVQTEGEQEKDGDTEDDGGEKKELSGLKGGEKEMERRMDGDEGATRDMTRNSPVSMCFDVAVAMATMRREKEKECEKEKEKERQRDWGSEVQ
ncbi:hypothetical protein PAMP_005247 [Pampus punctatissimus]